MHFRAEVNHAAYGIAQSISGDRMLGIDPHQRDEFIKDVNDRYNEMCESSDKCKKYMGNIQLQYLDPNEPNVRKDIAQMQKEEWMHVSYLFS